MKGKREKIYILLCATVLSLHIQGTIYALSLSEPHKDIDFKQIALTHYRFGKFSDALAYFEEALKLAPEDKVIRRYLVNLSLIHI